MRKIPLIIAAAALSIGLLAGCSGGAPASSSSASASSDATASSAAASSEAASSEAASSAAAASSEASADAQSEAKVQSGTVTTNLDMRGYDAGKVVRVWVPAPTNGDYQVIDSEAIDAPGATSSFNEDALGNKMAYIEWSADAKPEDRVASVSFHATRTEALRPEFKEDTSENAIPADISKNYLGSSKMVVVDDPAVVALSEEITKDKTTVLDKARAVYDWIYDNMERDNNVVGCGDGDVCRLIAEDGRAGKCTDINSTFVALCRAAGVPAREMFGIRMNEPNITGNQHCWCEFYLPGTGWVPADPADVLKAVLNDKLSKDSAEALEKKEYYWGQWDEKRVEYSSGRDLTLEPAQAGEALNDFGYPYGEVDGKALDYYKPEEFIYSVSFLADSVVDAGVKEVNVPKNYIKAADLQAAIEAKDDSKVILDLRKAEDYAASHIPGSVSVSMDSAVSDNDYATALADMTKALGEIGKDKELVLVCYTGNKYAQAATDVLNALGSDMSKVFTLEGGFTGWTEAKLPVEP